MTFKCPKCGERKLTTSASDTPPNALTECESCGWRGFIIDAPAREPADGGGGAVVYWMTTNINGDRRTPRRIFEHRSDAYHSAATERLDADSVVPVVPKSALDAANADAAAMREILQRIVTEHARQNTLPAHMPLEHAIRDAAKLLEHTPNAESEST